MAHQGNLDGLCGPYAIVNAFDRCGLNEEWLGQDLFRIACLEIEGWPRVLWKGTDFSQMKAMLKACTKALRKAHEEAGEGYRVRVEYPFSGARRPESDREYWLRFDELCAPEDVMCGILGMEHPWRHWIVFRDNGKSLTMFDTGVRGRRRRIPKKEIHAGCRNRNKYRVNRKELVLFRTTGPD